MARTGTSRPYAMSLETTLAALPSLRAGNPSLAATGARAVDHQLGTSSHTHTHPVRRRSGGGRSRLRDVPVPRPALDHGGIPAGPFLMSGEHRYGGLVTGQTVEDCFVGGHGRV